VALSQTAGLFRSGWKKRLDRASSGEKLDNCQQDDRSKQRDQQGRDADGIIDRADA
jgi:hypothetical protein